MFVQSGRWRVPKVYSEKHREIIGALIENQSRNREKFLCINTRIFLLESRDSGEETWIYVDEYVDREAYNLAVEAYHDDDPVHTRDREIKGEWVKYVVPDSLESEVWLERYRAWNPSGDIPI